MSNNVFKSFPLSEQEVEAYLKTKNEGFIELWEMFSAQEKRDCLDNVEVYHFNKFKTNNTEFKWSQDKFSVIGKLIEGELMNDYEKSVGAVLEGLYELDKKKESIVYADQDYNNLADKCYFSIFKLKKEYQKIFWRQLSSHMLSLFMCNYDKAFMRKPPELENREFFNVADFFELKKEIKEIDKSVSIFEFLKDYFKDKDEFLLKFFSEVPLGTKPLIDSYLSFVEVFFPSNYKDQVEILKYSFFKVEDFSAEVQRKIRNPQTAPFYNYVLEMYYERAGISVCEKQKFEMDEYFEDLYQKYLLRDVASFKTDLKKILVEKEFNFTPEGLCLGVVLIKHYFKTGECALFNKIANYLLSQDEITLFHSLNDCFKSSYICENELEQRMKKKMGDFTAFYQGDEKLFDYVSLNVENAEIVIDCGKVNVLFAKYEYKYISDESLKRLDLLQLESEKYIKTDLNIKRDSFSDKILNSYIADFNLLLQEPPFGLKLKVENKTENYINMQLKENKTLMLPIKIIVNNDFDKKLNEEMLKVIKDHIYITSIFLYSTSKMQTGNLIKSLEQGLLQLIMRYDIVEKNEVKPRKIKKF